MVMAILQAYSTPGITSGKNSLSRPQSGSQFENFEISNTDFHSIFHGYDGIGDVTGCPQSRPSIFPYKWNKNIFHDK